MRQSRYVELAPEKKFALCSDFLSSLQSLTVLYCTDALSMQVQWLIHCLLMRKYQLVFCWVPGHVGICSNELADKAAKDGTQNVIFALCHQDYIKQTILKLWQSA